jgi:hypothetical protein
MEGAYRTAALFRNSPEANELWLLRLQSLPYLAQVKSIIQQSEVEESLQSKWSGEPKPIQ